VLRFEKGNAIIDLGDVEAILPRQEQNPREKFRQGEIIKAYLLKAEKHQSGLEIVLSRADAGFVSQLFALEVPEITQGIVEIRSIAREVGERTKLAVISRDEKIDPVGACVGMRGARVKEVVKEVSGERIDIIRWTSDIKDLVKAAVSPAEIYGMQINESTKEVSITVPSEQLALLIGKRGRNIRLASRLVGWEIKADVLVKEVEPIPLDKVDGLDEKLANKLKDAGHEHAAAVLKAGASVLIEISGVGEKTAEKILSLCKAAVERSTAGPAKTEDKSATDDGAGADAGDTVTPGKDDVLEAEK
jgi:N utilization substance protein A